LWAPGEVASLPGVLKGLPTMKARVIVDPVDAPDSRPRLRQNVGDGPDSGPNLRPPQKSGLAEDEPTQGEAQKPQSATRASPADSVGAGGLTSDEARRRLEKFGPNAMPDTSVHPLRLALEKFWAPVPWMLEAAIVLELVLGKYVEASIIAFLLVFNAALGLLQESRAQATLAALKSRLVMALPCDEGEGERIGARAHRESAWNQKGATRRPPRWFVEGKGGASPASLARDVKLRMRNGDMLWLDLEGRGSPARRTSRARVRPSRSV
jgi:Cation transporter/ATPase, N-terminus